MTFTYNHNLSDPISQVRFKIGDTDTTGGILPTGRHFSDEEISAVLAQKGGDVVEAAIKMIDTAITAWARVGAQRLGPQSISNSFIVADLQKVRDRLVAEASGVDDGGAIAVHWKRIDGWTPEE